MTCVPWAGLGLMTLIFLANALGVLDQSVAERELAATRLPPAMVKGAVAGGRLLQLVAAPCLLHSFTRPVAAMALTGFLMGATLTAHAFWRAAAADRDRQLANFLKNSAIIGGLLVAAAWKA